MIASKDCESIGRYYKEYRTNIDFEIDESEIYFNNTFKPHTWAVWRISYNGFSQCCVYKCIHKTCQIYKSYLRWMLEEKL